MSDYRRFVSYIYLYENGVKSMNAGFVKVESRNGQCRIGLSLKNVYTGMGRFKVYMFIRFGQELRGVYIGDVQIKNHGSDWNFRTDPDNIAGSGYRLDQMSGMIIKGEGDRFYGTRWDQGDLDMGRFVTEWDDAVQPVDMAAMMESESVLMKEKIEKVAQEEEVTEPVQEPQIQAIPVAVNEMEQVRAEPSLNTEKLEGKKAGEAEPFVIAQEESRELANVEMDERSRNFGKIIDQCPGMYPFEDDKIEVCARLEPKDIGMMPIDCWSYGSNSFLLHGYYSYRHLILARMKSENGEQKIYILGVPGTRHSREAFMANMFGFREFKPIREGNESNSDFGYWYTQLG